jgi:hypothetical protein
VVVYLDLGGPQFIPSNSTTLVYFTEINHAAACCPRMVVSLQRRLPLRVSFQAVIQTLSWN